MYYSNILTREVKNMSTFANVSTSNIINSIIIIIEQRYL